MVIVVKISSIVYFYIIISNNQHVICSVVIMGIYIYIYYAVTTHPLC